MSIPDYVSGQGVCMGVFLYAINIKIMILYMDYHYLFFSRCLLYFLSHIFYSLSIFFPFLFFFNTPLVCLGV